ncbi:MAG: hypothetical protein HYX25_03750 [Candidatus Solibacter usitatus]|nr:hypothetical protein [Candidatus Solibacter usitatus]
MYARSVSIRLKEKSLAEFTLLIEQHALLLVGKQKGFQDELALFVPGGREAVAISLWDEKQNADRYGRNGYLKLLKALSRVIEGTPQVRTFEVCYSTFHKIVALARN